MQTTRLISLSKTQVALAQSVGGAEITSSTATWNEGPDAVAARFEGAAESMAEAVANADNPAKAKQLLASLTTLRRYITEADAKHLRVEEAEAIADINRPDDDGPTLESAAEAMKPADEAPAAAPAAKATKATKASKSTDGLHMSCPDCGFKFTKPQAKCRVPAACASRKAGATSKGKGTSKATTSKATKATKKATKESASSPAPVAAPGVPTGDTMVELNTDGLKAIGQQLLKSGAPITITSNRLIVKGGADWVMVRDGLAAAIKVCRSTKQDSAADTMQGLLDAITRGGRQSARQEATAS